MVDTNPLVGFYPIVLDIPMPISPNFMAVHHAQKTIETTVAAHFAPFYIFVGVARIINVKSPEGRYSVGLICRVINY